MNNLNKKFYYDDFSRKYPMSSLIVNSKSKMLTKSKFKLGLECTGKLFYSLDKQYNNVQMDDSFMKSLAEGGFQVEEYARQHYPGGIFIQADHHEYAFAHEDTMQLLRKRENVVLFEAGFKFEHLFIRADIVVKKGNHIQLLEVKAKSYDEHNTKKAILKDNGQLSSEWKPYLFDLAFQTYVMQQCLPGYTIESFLILADKNKVAKVDGLNQNYRVTQSPDVPRHIAVMDASPVDWQDSILIRLDQTEVVRRILNNEEEYRPGYSFHQALAEMIPIVRDRIYPNHQVKQSTCKKCEFRKKDFSDAGVSGMERCFTEQRGINPEALYEPNLLDVWDLRNSQLFDAGHFALSEITEDLWAKEEKEDHFSHSHRQWIQIAATQMAPATQVLAAPLCDEMKTWQFPLHFIDFETTRSALPFYAGRKPYEQIAFQYSHHIMQADGSVVHQGQSLVANGSFPNFAFIRQLRNSLQQDKGSIMTYSQHENTVVKEIKEQLLRSQEADRDELIAFIDELMEGRLVDLLKVVKKYYYHPYMKGSNSIKDVLPTILRTSAPLQAKYGQTIEQIGLSSLNFNPTHTWLPAGVTNPYKTLTNIQDGGAAMIAYARLMYTDISDEDRNENQKSLLQYCELDTLAMVMLYEHLRELTGEE